MSPEASTPDPTTEQPKSTLLPKPKLSHHPAIQTYRDVFHTYPKVPTYPTIIKEVGDKLGELALWRECCTYWLGKGWNPHNITDQLQRFNEQWLDIGPGSSHEEVIDGLLYNVYADGSRELATHTD
jgi:hypothetical protein